MTRRWISQLEGDTKWYQIIAESHMTSAAEQEKLHNIKKVWVSNRPLFPWFCSPFFFVEAASPQVSKRHVETCFLGCVRYSPSELLYMTKATFFNSDWIQSGNPLYWTKSCKRQAKTNACCLFQCLWHKWLESTTVLCVWANRPCWLPTCRRDCFHQSLHHHLLSQDQSGSNCFHFSQDSGQHHLHHWFHPALQIPGWQDLTGSCKALNWICRFLIKTKQCISFGLIFTCNSTVGDKVYTASAHYLAIECYRQKS